MNVTLAMIVGAGSQDSAVRTKAERVLSACGDCDDVAPFLGVALTVGVGPRGRDRPCPGEAHTVVAACCHLGDGIPCRDFANTTGLGSRCNHSAIGGETEGVLVAGRHLHDVLPGVDVELPAPPIFLRCVKSTGESRFRLPLVIVTRTVGAHTGWLRLVAETPERAVSFELRIKQDEVAEAAAQMGDVDGRNPEAVRDELERLLSISDGDVISIEIGNGQSLIRVHGTILPTVLETICLPVTQHLVGLQTHTDSVLVLPSIAEITDGQFRYLSLLASIYGGNAHLWDWKEVVLQVPEDAAEAARIKELAAGTAAGRQILIKVEAPAFQLGNRTYAIDHPLVSTAHSAQVEPGVEPALLRPGDIFRLIPGDDTGVTTAKVVDWTPGSISFD